MADQFALQHHSLLVEGRRLHCVSQGDGPKVMLIPGWPQTWYTWRYVMQHLAEIGYCAVAFDPPGTGESEPPVGGYSTGNIALILHQAMLQLGCDRFPVIGHDIGMWVGYALGADFPQAVESLILTEAVIPGLAPAPEIFVSAEENKFLWHFMFNQLHGLPEILIAGRERAYLSYMFDKWSWRRGRVAVEHYIQAYSVPGKLAAGFDYYRAIPETIRQNQQRAASTLVMPVLAIGAQHATQDAPALTMQQVAPQLQSAIVEDCGHFITEECPEAFCALVMAFLRECAHVA